jgi:uncharacterized protein (DUF305 family)
MKRSRTISAAAVALTAALALAGCGQDGHDTGTGHGSRTPHNAADVTFAQMMIPHHRQALEMADLAPSRSGSPEVEELAAEIDAAQEPEIRTLTAWLEEWGAPAPDASGGTDHGSMEHGPMAGMMTDADMADLKAATGSGFDRMFLEMMIEHHTGAVQMAETVLAQGENREARALAEEIRSTQAAEIAEMRMLLETLG